MLRSTYSPPGGFFALGACALTFGAVLAMILANGMLSSPGELPARAAVAVTGVLAFVAAEALFFTRPWAYRASAALAASYGAMMLIVAAETGSWGGVTGLTALSAAVIVPLVRHVHETLHPPAPRRRRPPARAPGAP
jgi:hypothetical protein